MFLCGVGSKGGPQHSVPGERRYRPIFFPVCHQEYCTFVYTVTLPCLQPSNWVHVSIYLYWKQGKGKFSQGKSNSVLFHIHVQHRCPYLGSSELRVGSTEYCTAWYGWTLQPAQLAHEAVGGLWLCHSVLACDTPSWTQLIISVILCRLLRCNTVTEDWLSVVGNLSACAHHEFTPEHFDARFVSGNGICKPFVLARWVGRKDGEAENRQEHEENQQHLEEDQTIAAIFAKEFALNESRRRTRGWRWWFRWSLRCFPAFSCRLACKWNLDVFFARCSISVTECRVFFFFFFHSSSFFS